jgi:hypothetical protein
MKNLRGALCASGARACPASGARALCASGARACPASGALHVLAFLFFCMSAVGCSREPPATHSLCNCDEPGAKPVDPQLMAWLSKARTLHHLADLGEADGAFDRAIASLEQLVTGLEPSGPRPEVDEVMADSYARMAELRVRQEEFERAEDDVVKGLERARARTYFRGHLFEVRGLVYEKLSEKLAKAGKGAEAEEARQKATRASSEAVRLQDEVIEQALADSGSPTRD